MPLPGPRFAAALLAWGAAGVLLVAGLVPAIAYWSAGALLLALALADARGLSAAATPGIARDLPPVVPVGVEREVRLVLRHEHGAPLAVEAHDLHPGDWSVTGLPRRLVLAPGSHSAFTYSLVPNARGSFEFAGCVLRLRSPLGFWRQKRVVPARQGLRVLPNFAPLARLALVGAEQASRVVGAHIRRRRGEGTEFQQLREYREGDALRQIDWKASRRALKLISREYQVERNQQVMLLLDTGRRMLARDGALAHFECEPWANYDGGDHVIFVVRVLRHAVRAGNPAPLIFFRGRYRDIVDETERDADIWAVVLTATGDLSRNRRVGLLQIDERLRGVAELEPRGADVGQRREHVDQHPDAAPRRGLWVQQLPTRLPLTDRQDHTRRPG